MALPFNEISENRKKFDKLFQQVAGIDPDKAKTNEQGWLFMPLKAGEADQEIRKELIELAGPSGWKNYLVNDEYAGYWIKRPE